VITAQLCTEKHASAKAKGGDSRLPNLWTHPLEPYTSEVPNHIPTKNPIFPSKAPRGAIPPRASEDRSPLLFSRLLSPTTAFANRKHE